MKKLAAFIIEDRFFEDFGKICSEHFKHLPKDTDLFVYTSDEHVEKYTEQLSKYKLKATFLPYNQNQEIPVSIKYIPGLEQLLQDARMKSLFNMCMVMTTPEFWKDYFDYERVLIFQRDTAILRGGIDGFFEYDYVGAPCYNFVKDQTIQNGGLSLRNPRVMEYICRMYGWKTDLQDLMVVGQYSTASFFAEDIFFCLRMIKHNAGRLAPFDVAKKFSVESKFELGTLGYHRIDAYLSEDEQKQIKEQYK
jgi:hypothetical protein